MMPLAVPEWSGAMSMGTAHIGPMVISAKKKPADRHNADTVRSLENIMGSSERHVRPMQIDTIRLRARFRLEVAA